MAIVNWQCALGDAPPVTLACGPTVAIAPRDDSVDTNTIIISGTGTINSFGDAPRVTKRVFFAAGQTLHHNPPALTLLFGQDRVFTDVAVGTYMCDGAGNWRELGCEGGAPLGIGTGTVMLFVQPTAPTGWTKLTTQNNKALRIVSGTTGGSAGGLYGFTSVFNVIGTSGSGETNLSFQTGDSPSPTFISYVGDHAHTVDLRVQYVDAILASKT